MNTIQEIYETCKINWTNFYAVFDDCQSDSPIEFETMPEEFVKFAKRNIQVESKQSRIDAMGNAKRAIEAQIDLLISTLGYDYKKFDNHSTYPIVKTYISEKYKGDNCEGIVPRIKLLNILGLAPTLLLSEIRHLRNKMEHEYIAPSLESVKKAIEVAELFINSSNRKLSYAATHVSLSNNKITELEKMHYANVGYPYIDIIYRIYQSTEEVTILLCESNEVRHEINLNVDDNKYIDCIELVLKEDSNLLPGIFGYQLDPDHIKNQYE